RRAGRQPLQAPALAARRGGRPVRAAPRRRLPQGDAGGRRTRHLRPGEQVGRRRPAGAVRGRVQPVPALPGLPGAARRHRAAARDALVPRHRGGELMLPTQAAELTSAAPAGVGEALDLVAAFDGALENGLGRPGAEQSRALAELAGAMAATPLGDPVREAVDAIGSGTVGDAQIAALAGARSALIGSVHDALLAAADTALGRTRDADPEPDKPAAAPTGPLGGVRSWLTELAVNGWRGVDRDIAGGADQAIEALLGDPDRRRAAVLLDGLAAELQANAPVATMDALPARRWADLWARAVLLTQETAQAGPSGSAAPATGRLLPLGADVHEHGTAVQLQVHAVLEPAGGRPHRKSAVSVWIA